MKSEEQYRGDLIDGLMQMVDRAIQPDPESRQIVKDALWYAYADGKLRGVVSGASFDAARRAGLDMVSEVPLGWMPDTEDGKG